MDCALEVELQLIEQQNQDIYIYFTFLNDLFIVQFLDFIMELNTDSNYFAFTDGSIDKLIKPNMQEEYDMKKNGDRELIICQERVS